MIFTVGHSTRTLEELVALLRENHVGVLVDVRRYPRSRRYPHFNDDALAASLPGLGLAYVPMGGALGGRRTARKDSTNLAWRNESFRGYADYTASDAFQRALADLLALARGKAANGDANVAIMCAEAVPWRCHRSLIADALTARAETVVDIIGPGATRTHELPDFARVEGAGPAARVAYPAPTTSSSSSSPSSSRQVDLFARVTPPPRTS